MSETWLLDQLEAEVNVDNYEIFRADSKRARNKRGRFGGGVALYLRDDIAASTKQILDFSNNVVEILCVYSEKENICIATVYRQPDDSTHGRTSTNNEFKAAINKLTEAINSIDGTPDLIIGGDFNLPHINWDSYSPSRQCPNEEKEMLATLNSICSELHLTQVIKEPTHYQGNILDLVFTNNIHLIHNTIVVPSLRNISHHSMVTIQTQYKAPIQTEDPKDSPRLSPLDYLNFHSKESNWKAMNNELNKDWENLLNNKSPSEMLEDIYTTIHQVSETHIPRRKQPNTQKTKNRYIREKENLRRRKRRINKQICNAKSPAKKDRLFKRLIDEEVKLQKLAKQTNMFYEQKAVNAIKENAKYFFSYAKRKSKVKTKIGPLFNTETDQMTNNSTEMAEVLADQYSSVFSKPSTEPPEIDESTLPINNITITPGEIMEAIEELRNNAASGPDGIPAILLKKCKVPLAAALSTFWNKCMEVGNIPSSLKSSIIPPIHKGGNKSDAANYRPVALTSHMIKIYEKVIRNRLANHLDNNNSLNKNQHGFRKGRSCLTQLLAHHDNIMNLLEQGYNVDVVYLDFAKAFDKVDHNILLHKLKNLGINGKTLRWIQNFLEDRVQRVVVNGKLSTAHQVISGVPQGSVLGPLLFLVLIGDIDSNILHSLIASFADDTRATKGIETETDAAELQNDLFRIYDWSQKNNMKFNSLTF